MTSSTITTTMDMTVKLGITLPKSILLKIDQKRGDIPRSRISSGERLKAILIKGWVKNGCRNCNSSFMPFLSTIGFGGIAGFLVGFALKRIMKILAVIAGVFFAALMYLESRHIVNVNWAKLQTISNSIVSTITTTTTNATTTTGGGGGNASYFRQ